MKYDKKKIENWNKKYVNLKKLVRNAKVSGRPEDLKKTTIKR